MPFYEFTARRGKEVSTCRVGARDEEEARVFLGQRGFVELAIQDPGSSGESASADDASYTTWRPRGWLVGLLWVTTVVVFLLYQQGMLSCLGLVVAVAIALVGGLALRRRGSSGMPYDRLLDAYAWRRHDEVLRLGNELSATGSHLSPLAQLDVDFRCAGVLWSLGRDSDAEAVVDGHRRDDDAEASRLWWGRRAGSLFYAWRYREAIEAAREALAVSPTHSTSLLDLAMMLARDRRAAEAREVLARVHEARGPLKSSFRAYVLGMVQVEEGDYRSAAASLSRARWARWLPLGPGAASLLGTIDAYLAIALAPSDPARAMKALQRCRPWLEAVGEQALLARCERALSDRGIPYR